MPTKFWASGLLLAAAVSVTPQICAQRSVQLSSGKLLSAFASRSGTVFVIPKPKGGKTRLRVKRDDNVAPGDQPSALKLVAEIPGSALILVDTYASIAGGMSYCQAGEESFLRVVAISSARPIETYRTKLESCRDNIELASPGMKWSADTNTLEVHWLSSPPEFGNSGKPRNLQLKIAPDGGVAMGQAQNPR